MPVRLRADARVTLIVGGARSGKSRLAERLAEQREGPLTYLATAEAWDDEMRARIMQHRARRGDRWQTVEAPIAVADALQTLPPRIGAVLVDCLTLWLSNLMHANRDVEQETERLLAVLPTSACPVIMVSNEVGLGIVPDNKLARDFRDRQGRLNQRIAELADHVIFTAVGLPLVLK
ncbi:MAG TPA: bifunctional adenosylcobinamide kinase/adenosylcobinamide-phosphate guanylyltransferase [Ferrovibrio sp.]|uniref:bifunctional adenosylcobinamide kinase/adenosylcobinamide-phosphate guanylyltransferase n=1 Tax=Ferrovibrio sp. TaxID=1917215 RepID=UPI002ED56E7B